MRRAIPRRHYVMIDDKLRVLQAMKDVLGDRLTTVFPRQGHYAHDPKIIAEFRAADVNVETHRRIARPRFFRATRGQPRHCAIERTHETHPAIARTRTESLARQHHAQDARRRHARALHRGIFDHGTTSNPTIFDEAIGDGNAYDAAFRESARRLVGRKIIHGTGAGRSAPRRRSVPAGFRQHRGRSMAGYRWKFRPCSRPTRKAPSTPRNRSMRWRRSQKSVRENSGHAGRHSGHRGIDLSRHSDQRDAAVLLRSVSRRGRSVHARYRAAHREKTVAARRLRRVAVHQPLGRGEQQAIARQSAQHARHRGRQTDVPRLSPVARLAALEKTRRCRRDAATVVVGEHGDEGSERVRYAVYQRIRRARHDRHDA